MKFVSAPSTPLNSIKIFGERHTSTNAISKFIKINFDLKHLDYSFLGWKHRMAPSATEWQKFDLTHTLIIVTTRNPYTWLKAMHREPYNQHMPSLKGLPFEIFLRHSFEDYENIIAMWNMKYSAYLKFVHEVPHALIVKAEELCFNPNGLSTAIKKVVGEDGRHKEVEIVDYYMGGFGKSKSKEFHKDLKDMPNYSERELKLINNLLDSDLMAKLGYEFKHCENIKRCID